jgi:hypothetical protein
MALSDLWSRRSREPESNYSSVSLAELESNYDIVEVVDEPGASFAIVTPKATPLPGELGNTSPSPWTSTTRQEYNRALQGIRGLEQYDKMRKSDGTVKGTLRLMKTPVLSARWFIEPGGKRIKDKRAAEFIEKNLMSGDIMSIGWNQILQEALLMLDFGYYMFEKVYDEQVVPGFGPNAKNIWRKLAPRHPMDVETWVFDENGGPVGVWMKSLPGDANEAAQGPLGRGFINDQSSPYPGMTNVPTGGVSGIPGLDPAYHPNCVFIPIEKLIVFSFDREAGNIEGTSVLRSAYKHWYYKEQLYKIDAIQKERHGIGIPIIKLPMGYKNEDKQAAENLGRNIRTNERAHIVLPPGWDLAMLKLEGSPMDCMKSIDHHDALIEKNIVAYFLESKRDSDADLFLKAVRYVADIVCESFNNYCIQQLVDYNFPGAAYPKLKVRRIGESADWRTLSFAIRNMIGAGVVVPDDRLEETMRDEMDLPEADPDSARVVNTPQAGPGRGAGGGTGPSPTAPGLPRVGPPRQAPVNNQRNTRGLPRGNAGQDQSGGK